MVRRSALAPLAALLLLLATLAPGTAGAVEPEPAFCAAHSLHDYLVPLHLMPPLRELPSRARDEPIFRQGVRIGAEGPSLAIGGGAARHPHQGGPHPRR